MEFYGYRMGNIGGHSCQMTNEVQIYVINKLNMLIWTGFKEAQKQNQMAKTGCVVYINTYYDWLL